eukprot:228722_1
MKIEDLKGVKFYDSAYWECVHNLDPFPSKELSELISELVDRRESTNEKTTRHRSYSAGTQSVARLTKMCFPALYKDVSALRKRIMRDDNDFDSKRALLVYLRAFKKYISSSGGGRAPWLNPDINNGVILVETICDDDAVHNKNAVDLTSPISSKGSQLIKSLTVKPEAANEQSKFALPSPLTSSGSSSSDVNSFARNDCIYLSDVDGWIPSDTDERVPSDTDGYVPRKPRKKLRRRIRKKSSKSISSNIASSSSDSSSSDPSHIISSAPSIANSSYPSHASPSNSSHVSSSAPNDFSSSSSNDVSSSAPIDVSSHSRDPSSVSSAAPSHVNSAAPSHVSPTSDSYSHGSMSSDISTGSTFSLERKKQREAESRFSFPGRSLSEQAISAREKQDILKAIELSKQESSTYFIRTSKKPSSNPTSSKRISKKQKQKKKKKKTCTVEAVFRRLSLKESSSDDENNLEGPTDEKQPKPKTRINAKLNPQPRKSITDFFKESQMVSSRSSKRPRPQAPTSYSQLSNKKAKCDSDLPSSSSSSHPNELHKLRARSNLLQSELRVSRACVITARDQAKGAGKCADQWRATSMRLQNDITKAYDTHNREVEEILANQKPLKSEVRSLTEANKRLRSVSKHMELKLQTSQKQNTDLMKDNTSLTAEAQQIESKHSEIATNLKAEKTRVRSLETKLLASREQNSVLLNKKSSLVEENEQIRAKHAKTIDDLKSQKCVIQLSETQVRELQTQNAELLKEKSYLASETQQIRARHTKIVSDLKSETQRLEFVGKQLQMSRQRISSSYNEKSSLLHENKRSCTEYAKIVSELKAENERLNSEIRQAQMNRSVAIAFSGNNNICFCSSFEISGPKSQIQEMKQSASKQSASKQSASKHSASKQSASKQSASKQSASKQSEHAMKTHNTRSQKHAMKTHNTRSQNSPGLHFNNDICKKRYTPVSKYSSKTQLVLSKPKPKQSKSKVLDSKHIPGKSKKSGTK